MSDPEVTTTQLLALLSERGTSDYIGEAISQLDHSLQAAHLASTNEADNETIIAALLHDIGQFLPAAEASRIAGRAVENMRDSSSSPSPSSSSSSSLANSAAHHDSGSVGRVGHEMIGAEYLSGLGFSGKVCELVGGHVRAKRYLCAVEGQYYDALSEASKRSLVLQGGPMSMGEVAEYRRWVWCEDMCRLRKWDDCAKEVGLEVPGVEAYRPFLLEHLREARLE